MSISGLVAKYDCEDDIIAVLSASEAALIDQVVELTIDRDAYRLLAQQAVNHGAELSRERDRLRDSYYRLLAEYRSVRSVEMRRLIQRGTAA